MTVQGGPGRIDVTSTTVQEGNPVEVSTVPGGQAWYQEEGSKDWVEIEIDPATGKGSFIAPVGAPSVTVSDRNLPRPSAVIVEILSRKP